MLEGWHWDYCDRACLLVEDEESTHCHFNGSKRFVKEHGNKVHNCLMFSVPFDSLLCNEYICNFRQQLVEGCKKLVPEGMTVHVVNPHGIILCKFVLDFLKPDCQVAAETLVIVSNFEHLNYLEGQPNLLAGDPDIVWVEVHLFVLCIFVIVARESSESCLSEIIKEWM